jgi:hypothetical protein
VWKSGALEPPFTSRKQHIIMPNEVDRTRFIFSELMKHLHEEFAAIRSLNLGVMSGTNVGDALALTRLRQLARELSLLAVSSELCSNELARMARKLSRQELASLQNLLDSQNMDELSDFIRLMVYNTGDLMCKEVVGKPPPASALRPISNDRSPTKPRNKSPVEKKTATVNRTTRRVTQRTDEDGIRFATLSPNSRLVQLARERHQSRLPKGPAEVSVSTTPEPRDEEELLLEAAAPLYESGGLGESMGPPNLRAQIRSPEPESQAPPLWSDVERTWKDAMTSTSTKAAIPFLGTTYLQPQAKLLVPRLEQKRKQEEEEEERLREEIRAQSPPRGAMSPLYLRKGSMFRGPMHSNCSEGFGRADSVVIAAVPSPSRLTSNEQAVTSNI